jgi:hypothetical protein
MCVSYKNSLNVLIRMRKYLVKIKFRLVKNVFYTIFEFYNFKSNISTEYNPTKTPESDWISTFLLELCVTNSYRQGFIFGYYI